MVPSMPYGNEPDVAATVLRALPDAVILLDVDGRLRWANRAAERLFGVTLAALTGTNAVQLVHPDDAGLTVFSLESVQEKSIGTPVELRVRSGSGWRLVEAVGTNLVEHPEVHGLVVSMRDLTERRRWEVACGDDRSFRALVQHAASILFLVDRHGIVRSVSAAVTRLLGHSQETLEGRHVEVLVDESERAAVRSAVARAVDAPDWSAAPTTIEVELVRGDGRPSVPFELSIVNLLRDPTVQGLVISAHDITQLRATREALEELATHDPLTGLPNRSSLHEHLAKRVTEPETAVVFLDLDGFKPINDRYGHTVGDELLRELATRLRTTLRRGDLVARYGGDEFVVVATVADTTEIDRLTARLIQAIEIPVSIEGVGTIAVSASVGLAKPLPEDTPMSLLARADSAMYVAKLGNRQGRDDRPDPIDSMTPA
ncbi:MAG TPA: sensor domain-containing diguanylate cyclase [Acidimicrobiales bacterium]|nr:sensor domain-containing diguanylate cyclase [Acidimicrobiales bacterium]